MTIWPASSEIPNKKFTISFWLKKSVFHFHGETTKCRYSLTHFNKHLEKQTSIEHTKRIETFLNHCFSSVTTNTTITDTGIGCPPPSTGDIATLLRRSLNSGDSITMVFRLDPVFHEKRRAGRIDGEPPVGVARHRGELHDGGDERRQRRWDIEAVHGDCGLWGR